MTEVKWLSWLTRVAQYNASLINVDDSVLMQGALIVREYSSVLALCIKSFSVKTTLVSIFVFHRSIVFFLSGVMRSDGFHKTVVWDVSRAR